METKAMTDEEAERMAQLLWPPNGRAWKPDALIMGLYIYCVGEIAMASVLHGIGLSWESAFEEARKRGRT
jgi:hypothetical protein